MTIERSTLCVMATGLGKTVVMAAVAKHWPAGRVLVLVHREELAHQFVSKCHEHAGLVPDVEMRDYYADQCTVFSRSKVVVASVPTMCTKKQHLGFRRRMERFDPGEFGLVLTDEAHHATAESYRRIYEHFGQNASIAHLGVTATPDRSDKRGLSSVFRSVAVDLQINWGVREGWLVPLRQHIVHLDELDLRQVRTKMKDLNARDLERQMLKRGNLDGVAAHTRRRIGTRQALVYCSGVAQAHALAQLFSTYGLTAVAVDGKTDRDVRRGILAAHGRQVQVICNCGVLTEGYDAPGVSVIVNARPTKSRSLYTQIVGRGTRPLPGVVDSPALRVQLRPYQSRAVWQIMQYLGVAGFTQETQGEDFRDRHHRLKGIANSPKPECLVLDFTGVAGRHQLVTAVDLVGEAYTPQERALTKRKLRAGDDKPVTQLLDESRQELTQAALDWQTFRLRETLVTPDLLPAAVTRPSKADPATAAQLRLLRRFRLPESKLEGLTKGQAGRLIGKLTRRKA